MEQAALRDDFAPQLDEAAVIAATDAYLGPLGYQSSVSVDAASREVHIWAQKMWDPGALRAIGMQPRQVSGTATAVLERGVRGGDG